MTSSPHLRLTHTVVITRMEVGGRGPLAPQPKDFPMATTAPLGEQLKAWQEENPLRQWRKENSITLHQTSAMAHVSVSTIQQWESGANTPSGENMNKLAVLIGPNVARRWTRWAKRNPLDQQIHAEADANND